MAQVSDEEIAREVRTLRNLRRRSGSGTGPGALPLDPDLPPPAPGQSVPTFSSNDDITLSSPDGLDGESGVFWVPAHLHPELAPGEFRAFLKSHTHADPENDTLPVGEAGVGRSQSWLARNGSLRGSAEGLGRKRSMLSRQYQPKPGDGVEDEDVPPVPSRQRMSVYRGRSGEKGLTLQDLQKLEEVMDEAGEEDDPEQVRTLLRRSLSMNVAPGFLQDDVPQDEHDQPVPPPRPGSILRRSARTKIRKAGLPGEGGAHRFASTRKGRTTAAPVIDIPGLEDDDDATSAAAGRYRTASPEYEETIQTSSSEHGRSEEDDGTDRFVDALLTQDHKVDSDHLTRRTSDSSTDEAHIFDAYARDSRSPSLSTESSGVSESDKSESQSPEASPPGGLRLELPPIPRSTSDSDWFKDTDKTPTQETSLDALQPPIRRPLPSDDQTTTLRPAAAHLPGSLNLGGVPPEQSQGSPVSPTFHTPRPVAHYQLPPGMAPPAQRTNATQPQPTKEQTPQPPAPASPQRTESPQPPPPTPTVQKEKEKEKKGGFFSKKDKDKKGKKEKDGFLGSLFGGSKKKQEEATHSVSNFSSAGPAAAAALLGSSKSARSRGLSPAPSPTSPGFNSYTRYPIHVERAVYRLSHIKLANARRPLYEQVLISNLMFWYLGVIGRNVTEDKKAEEDKKETKPPPAKGTPPKPADSGVAGRPLPREQIESVSTPKKTGLTKPERSRTPGREPEAPVRAPSYGLQSAQVDNEIRSANNSLKGPRPLSIPSQQQVPPPQQQQQPLHPQQPPQQHPQHPQYPQQQTQQPQHPPKPQQPPLQPQPPSPSNSTHSVHQSLSPQYPLGGQPPFAHLQQQNRTHSQPPPGAQRTLSPPAGGSQSRSNSDNGHGASMGPLGPRDPRAGMQALGGPVGPGGPRGLSHSQSLQDLRGPGAEQRYSAPVPYTSHAPPGGASPQMRRVTPEPRSPTGAYDSRDANRSPTRSVSGQQHPQHAGPQVGQIFHHPQASPSFRPPQNRGTGPLPGQVFPGTLAPRPTYGQQPGQVFRPPQPQPQQMARPPSGQGPAPGQWEAPQRLPPGASPSSQVNYPFRPPLQHPQQQQQPPQGVARGYSSHPQLGHVYPQQRPLGAAPGQGLAPGQHAPQIVSHPGAPVYRGGPGVAGVAQPPQRSTSHGAQPGQVLYPGQGQGLPQRQPSGDGYPRAQTVPGAYHHR